MNYSEAARSCLSKKDYAGYLENAQKQYELTGSMEDAGEVEKARKALSLHKEIEKFLKKNPSDYYDILGVSRDATQPEIKRAFNMLIMRFHPDRTGMHESGAVSGMIQNAYTTLGTPEKRRRYDMTREAPRFNMPGAGFNYSDNTMQNVFFNVFRAQGYQEPFMYSGDFYEHLYSQMYRRFNHRRPNTNDPDSQKVAAFLIIIILIFLAM